MTTLTSDDRPTPPRPRLRGALHAGMFPATVLAGVVLVATTRPGMRWAAAVYALTAALLFGTSGLFHRLEWSPRVYLALKRLDHANIFLIIAGSYTPFAATLLAPDESRRLLALVWGCALVGVLFRVLWVRAPRWLYTPLYVAFGWIAVFYLGAFLRTGGPAVVGLLAAGGALYTLGSIVYTLRWPNPSPRWFGFHEVFHAFTLSAFAAHLVGAALVLSGRLP